MHKSTPDTHAISCTQNTHTQTDASIQHLEPQLWSEKKTDPWAAKFLQSTRTTRIFLLTLSTVQKGSQDNSQMHGVNKCLVPFRKEFTLLFYFSRSLIFRVNKTIIWRCGKNSCFSDDHSFRQLMLIG